VVGLDVPRKIGPNQFAEITRWRPHDAMTRLEADERIYIALVEQLEAGRGYTLQGHPILKEPFIVGPHYRQPLFFHPPGGVAFFWMMRSLVGESGFALGELVSFTMFFWSVMLLGVVALRPFGGAAGVLLAIVAASTPIMAHVTGRLWLDGPLLGFATAACAVFLYGVQRRRTALVVAAGLLLGAASWIKLTAFLAAPGAIALAWAITPHDDRHRLLTTALVFAGLGMLVQLPWEVWQWRVYGTPFSEWAGRPAVELVQTNRYVKYLTSIRSPWIYVTLLPRVLWTLVPAVVLSAVQWRDRDRRVRAVALGLWIAVVTLTHIGLGTIGYSKLLRYVVLVSPAVALLFAMAASGLVTRAATLPGGRVVKPLLILLALTGLGLELTQSVVTTFLDNASHDLVMPLFGMEGFPR
jgi:4-amino-4-deoxy-L-arabinose transferase-like glycosyltransferase